MQDNTGRHFVLSDTAPKDWDALIEDNDGFFVNTTHFIHLYESMGIGRGRYLRVYENEELIFQITILETLLGGTFLLQVFPKIVRQFLAKVPFFVSFVLHFSPTVIARSRDTEQLGETLKQSISYIVSLAGKEGKNIGPADVIFFKEKALALDMVDSLKEEFPRLEVRPTGTTRLDMGLSREELLNSLGKKRRSDFRNARKNDVIIAKVGSIKELKIFYTSLRNEWKKLHLSVPSFSYYETLWGSPSVEIFLAYHKGNVVAGSGLMIFGQTCLEFSMFISRYERETNTRGGDLLKWVVFEHCLDRGIRFFDFSMIDVNESSEKQGKINFFKLKWGGDILYGADIFLLNPFMKYVQLIKKILLGK